MNLRLGLPFGAVRHMTGGKLDFWKADTEHEAREQALLLSKGNEKYWYVTEIKNRFNIFDANTDPINAVTSYQSGVEVPLERDNPQYRMLAFA